LVFCVPFPPSAPNRKACLPFVSGDGFRAYADFVFDELQCTLDPEKVAAGDTIFVKTDYIGTFFLSFHHRIKNPYILITHNSDYGVPQIWAPYLNDPKLIAWFGMNVENYSHPKLHPIPIGIANYEWAHGNGDTVQRAIQNRPAKSHLVYYNISVGTYPVERGLVQRLFSHAPYCYSSSGKDFENYLLDIASSQFVLAPRGNGIDTHRLWEALYMGAYPIVKRSTIDAVYEGLPVVAIQNWEEVTEEFLRKKSEEFSTASFLMERLSLSYWISLIDRFRSGRPGAPSQEYGN
jgi:hypothetical protein